MSEERQRKIAERQRQMRRRQEGAQARQVLSRVSGLTFVRFLDEVEEDALPVVYDQAYSQRVRPFTRLSHDTSAVDTETWLRACIKQIGVAEQCYLKLPQTHNAPWVEVTVERSGAWFVALWEQFTDHDGLRIATDNKGRIMVIEDLEWEYAAYWLERRSSALPTSLDEYAYLWTGQAREWVLYETGHGTLPIHRVTHMGLIIEDDAVAREVEKRMVEAGVPIVHELPE